MARRKIEWDGEEDIEESLSAGDRTFAAGSLAILSGLFGLCGWFAGALLGGSLSHALETSLRGCIIDYVRLRLWPAFNLADVAITVGALGVLVQMVITTKEAW